MYFEQARNTHQLEPLNHQLYREYREAFEYVLYLFDGGQAMMTLQMLLQRHASILPHTAATYPPSSAASSCILSAARTQHERGMIVSAKCRADIHMFERSFGTYYGTLVIHITSIFFFYKPY